MTTQPPVSAAGVPVAGTPTPDQPGQAPEWSQEAFEAAFAEAELKIGRFNLAVFGKTGVGKSTLVNAIFGESVAATGIGRPVTMGSHLYVHRTGKLGIYDTQGLEVGRDTAKIITELKRFIDNSRAMSFTEQVHLAWYCVRATDRRFEETEAAFIRELADVGLPVILVMTQVPGRRDQRGQLFLAPDAVELGRLIEGMGLPIHGGRAVMVNALADPFTGVEQHGLLDLLDATFRCAPQEAADALTAAQKIDPARKAQAAEKAVNTAAAAATAAGFTPIPFADAAVLVPIQLGMMAKISNIYDIPMQRATVASLAATTVTTQAGRAAATGLLKLVPGVGTLVGGAITGGVAGTVTFAVGTAWHRVCIGMAEGKYETVAGTLDSETIQRVFNQEVASIMRSRGIGRK
ncbi:MAG TPA: DUF697 domain-containing protein [Motilibacterales bacterium]|nr:DUF697 domain-containing protein [Motilibacterales bacterium]